MCKDYIPDWVELSPTDRESRPEDAEEDTTDFDGEVLSIGDEVAHFERDITGRIIDIDGNSHKIKVKIGNKALMDYAETEWFNSWDMIKL